MSVTPPITWESALVAVDVFLGPYPALIPAERGSDTVLAPRFSLDVVRRMHDATAKLAGSNGRVVQVINGEVIQSTIVDGCLQPGQVIRPDGDGLCAVPATAGQWTAVDIRWSRADECECGACGCPASAPLVNPRSAAGTSAGARGPQAAPPGNDPLSPQPNRSSTCTATGLAARWCADGRARCFPSAAPSACSAGRPAHGQPTP